VHDAVTDLVHEPTQVHEGGVDLTVADLYRVAEPGAVDFGGGELAAPDLEPVETRYRDADDDYGWWFLSGGTYLLEHNESLAVEAPVRVQVRDELRERGGTHPSLVTRDLGRVPLTVVEGGLRIKENARVSTVSVE
jgi:hypothetical protein